MTFTPEQASIDFEIRYAKGQLVKALRAPIGKGLEGIRAERIASLEEQIAGWTELAIEAGLDPESLGY